MLLISYDQAEKINAASEAVFLGKGAAPPQQCAGERGVTGFLLFAKGKYEDAYKNFNFAREYKDSGSESIPGILGMVCASPVSSRLLLTVICTAGCCAFQQGRVQEGARLIYTGM